MSYCLLTATIISKTELTELDAEPFKEFYKDVTVSNSKIIVNKRTQIKNPESFWKNYSMSNPDEIIVEYYFDNRLIPSMHGISVLYNGYFMSRTEGVENYHPLYWNNYAEIEIHDCIEDRKYKASEVQILFYLLSTLKSWNFTILDRYDDEITSGEIADIFIANLYADPRLNVIAKHYNIPFFDE